VAALATPGGQIFSRILWSESLRQDNGNNRYKAVRQAGLLTTIPVLLTVAPLIGFFIGRYLDGKLHTEPWLTIIFLVLGFVAAARQIASIIKAANKDSREPGNRD
jgi:ATP synthase protein I